MQIYYDINKFTYAITNIFVLTDITSAPMDTSDKVSIVLFLYLHI